jgi:NarL family two-component system sensor histidine kinase LiaS
MTGAGWKDWLTIPVRRLKWRLILSFVLVTLASMMMTAWWSFIGLTLYLARSQPEANLGQIRGELLTTLGPVIFPGLLVFLIPALLVSVLFGFVTTSWLENRLKKLNSAINAWGDGNFTTRIRDDAQDEVAHLSRQLNQMAAELETTLHTKQELAALDERNQLARDLHDSVKQQLAAARLQISAAGLMIQTDPVSAQTALQQAGQLTTQAQQELSNIILELRPAALSEQGLTSTAATYLDQWGKQTNITVQSSLSAVTGLNFDGELALFRVLQESLANVARHSRASNVKVSLQPVEKTVLLQIQDDGRGFNPAEIPNHGYGLHSMPERLAELGGSLKVDTAPGQGVTVTAHLPLEKRKFMPENVNE